MFFGDFLDELFFDGKPPDDPVLAISKMSVTCNPQGYVASWAG